MKNKIAVFFIVVALIGLGAVMVLNFFIQKASKEVMRYAIVHAKDFNLDIAEADFSSVKVSSFNSVTWKNFKMNFNLFKNGVPDPNKKYALNVNELTATLDLFAKNLTVSGKKLLIRSGTAASSDTDAALADPHSGKIESDDFRIPLRIADFNPENLVKKVRDICHELLYELSEKGFITVPVEFAGKTTFFIEDYMAVLRLQIVEEAEKYFLKMDKTDLRTVSESLTQKLNDVEIDFLSVHPIQSPELLRIKERAEKTSKEAHEADQTVPEDAYRHTLWSYLLTHEFGEVFAKEVTDAHERGATEGTEADHQMDYNNNTIGRQYAKAGYPENTIFRRVLADPNVIRSAD